MTAEHPERIGSYEVFSVIGEGAMGTVYKATEPTRGTVVAIKVLRAEFLADGDAVERFHREAEAVSRLHHPNVVQIIDKEQREEDLYFVMEYVPGSALEPILRRRRLSLREAFVIFKKVCRGLQAAHAEGIVHRDLSPRNILVSEDFETVKIADFGISRVESISQEMGTLSTSQVSLGSLHYMAPEQAADMRQTDHRADIYSLGVLFYEMLTGRVPVGRYSLPSAINSEVPSEIDPIVLRCLETNPGERFASVGRLLARVERLDDQLRLGLVSELKDISRSTSKIFLKSRRDRASKIAWTAAAVVVVALAIVYLLWQRRSTPVEVTATSDGGRTAASAAGEIARPTGGDSATEPRTGFVRIEPLQRANLDRLRPSALDFGEVVPPEVEGDGEEEAGSAEDRIASRRTGSGAAAASGSESPISESAPSQGPARATDGEVQRDLEVVRAKLDAGLFEPALRDVEGIIGTAEAGESVAAALLLKGEIHRAMGDLAEAKAAWIELDSRFRGAPPAAEGSYRLATLAAVELARSEPREVWKRYNDTIAAYPGTSWAARALMDRAELEKAEKWRIEDTELGSRVPMALISYRQMTSAFPADSAAEQAFFELAEMYEDLKRFDLAAATFEALASRFPDNRRDAWWRAAQLYDSRRLHDSEKAVAAYEKVPESSRHYDDAQRRLARLRR